MTKRPLIGVDHETGWYVREERWPAGTTQPQITYYGPLEQHSARALRDTMTNALATVVYRVKGVRD